MEKRKTQILERFKESKECKVKEIFLEKNEIELICLTCGKTFVKKINNAMRKNAKNICDCKRKKYNTKKINEIYSKEGYELLEEYKGMNEPTKTLHKICGYKWRLHPAHFLKSGSRCPRCAISGFVKTKEEIIEELKEIKNGEYELVSGYINSTKKAKFKHLKCGKEFEMEMARLRFKTNCPHCFGTPKKTTEDYKKEIFEKYGTEYEVLEEYQTNKIKIKHKHSCGKIVLMRPDQFLQKRTKCKCLINSSTSKEEKEIINFVKENYKGTILENDRKTLFFLELDIYLPELKLAIEFDGLYWHSEEKKGKDYHLEKTNKCEEKNIKLIHIFEDEWTLRKDIVKSRILKELNLIPKIKETEIKQIKSFEVFLEENALETMEEADCKIGVFKEKEMVAIAGYSKKTKKVKIVEKKEFVVIDLLKKIVTFIASNNKNEKEVIIEVDRRWYNKQDIEKQGFVFSHSTTTKFHYFEKQKRTKEKTLQRIFDCGTHIFKYILSSKTENE